METQEVAGQPEGAVETKPGPKPKKPRKTFSFGFVGPDGASLKLTLKLNKSGGATTTVSHKQKGGKSQRGMTSQYETIAKAEEALKKLTEKATKLGWVRKERKGFVKQPDAFAEMPSPGKEPKKK